MTLFWTNTKENFYMYTHIELWLSSVLLLLKENGKGPTSEGILQESWHSNDYIHSHSCPRTIYICQCMMFWVFFFILPARGGMSGGHTKKKRTQQDRTWSAPLPNALCCRAVPHVHKVPDGSHCRSLGVPEGVFMHRSLRWKATKDGNIRGFKQERVYKIPMVDC